MSRSQRRPQYPMLLLGAALLLAALLCGASALIVRGGIVAPPALHLRVGSVGIEAGMEHGIQDCPPHCEWHVPSAGARIYSVWFVSTTMDAGGERRQAQLLYAQLLR